MDSKTTYLLNTCLKNGIRYNRDLYKITVYANSFSVVRYFPNEPELEIKIPNKNLPYTDTWLMYSPNKGLFLNSIFVGPNILDFSENDYEQIISLGTCSILKEMENENYTSIDQITSDGLIMFKDGKIYAEGKLAINNIHKTIVSGKCPIIALGCFRNILTEKNITYWDIKNISSALYDGSTTYDFVIELGENSSLNVEPNNLPKDLEFKLNDKVFLTKVTNQNGELIYS